METYCVVSNNNSDRDSTVNADDVITSDSVAVLANKERERLKIQSDIESFLASGGKINAIDNNVVADPPKKPDSNYGSQPI